MKGGGVIKSPSEGSVTRGKVNDGVVGSSYSRAIFKLEEQADNSLGNVQGFVEPHLHG